jgi:hypothetical protein
MGGCLQFMFEAPKSECSKPDCSELNRAEPNEGLDHQIM